MNNKPSSCGSVGGVVGRSLDMPNITIVRCGHCHEQIGAFIGAINLETDRWDIDGMRSLHWRRDKCGGTLDCKADIEPNPHFTFN